MSSRVTMLGDPHHDGSERYVADPRPDLGDTITVFLRVPDSAAASRVWLRTTPDGDQAFAEATVDRRGDGETWWRADLEMVNPHMSYRWLLDGLDGYRWLHAGGMARHDVVDATDFRLTTDDPPPDWAGDAVFYQILPDRFARGGHGGDWPSWARPADWDDPLITDGDAAMRQVYGGDLHGARARLDHLRDLGVTAIWLNPFFPAESYHRYNAATFDHVDPLLGGDDALRALVRAAHAAGIRVIGDLTTNHSGDTHEWFRRAQADAGSAEAGFYFFSDHPHEYWRWMDVASLPTFDHRSPELRRRLWDGPDSVVARWLDGDDLLDGWRIDVAHMTGRRGAIDLRLEVARGLRRTLAQADPEAYLVAEDVYDATDALAGDAWHGVMDYPGFTRPVWAWLRDPDPPRHPDTGAPLPFMSMPVPIPRWGGTRAAATMQAFRATVPWRSVTHNMHHLDSHDLPRFSTITGDRERHLAGVGLLMTSPGVPCVFAGDEIGLTGADSDSARPPMPWDRGRWDTRLLDGYRTLIGLRNAHRALRVGGFRWAVADDDCLAYVRETTDERLLVAVTRSAATSARLPLTALGARRGIALLDHADLSVHGDAAVVSADGATTQVWSLE